MRKSSYIVLKYLTVKIKFSKTNSKSNPREQTEVGIIREYPLVLSKLLYWLLSVTDIKYFQ